MRTVLTIAIALMTIDASAWYYHKPSDSWSKERPKIIADGKYVAKPSDRLLDEEEWVHIDSPEAWSIAGENTRPKTPAEITAETAARDAEIARANAAAQKQEQARSAFDAASEIEIIRAAHHIQNDRINKIIVEIVRLNPASSNRLADVHMTFPEFRQGVKEELE